MLQIHRAKLRVHRRKCCRKFWRSTFIKYGATTNNLLGIEVVLMDGTITRFGGKAMDAEGYDFLGLMTGSEGLLRSHHRGNSKNFKNSRSC